MGNEDEVDFELELLRQAALTSLQNNRATKAGKRGYPQHRTTASNKNLIEIQTSSLLELEEDDDDPDCEEIVIAEGLDVNDSDCDEVIEEVMLSDGDEGSEPNSRTSSEDPQHKHKPQSLESNPHPPARDDESSSDDDALSVASRYSLYEDEPDGAGNNNLHKLPLRLRVPGQSTSAKDKELTNHQRRRTRSRSRDRSRSPFMSMGRGSRPRPRRSRTRSPPPPRRRPSRRSRSRSHGREFRRRSFSRDPPPPRVSDGGRDKPRRKEESRRPARSSPTPPLKSSRRDYPIRRRSRSSSREKVRATETNARPASKNKPATETSTESRKSPEPPPISGADQEVLEKRRRKFQDQVPLNRVEGKKIRLQSKVLEKEHQNNQEGDHSRRDRNKSVQKSSVILKDNKDSSNSSSEVEKVKLSVKESEVDRKRSSHRKSSRNLGKDEEGEEEVVKVVEKAEEEDLRAKLIKRKMKAQQDRSMGTGRIFTEALKGTRLISNKDSSSSRKGLKRKVSLTYV